MCWTTGVRFQAGTSLRQHVKADSEAQWGLFRVQSSRSVKIANLGLIPTIKASPYQATLPRYLKPSYGRYWHKMQILSVQICVKGRQKKFLKFYLAQFIQHLLKQGRQCMWKWKKDARSRNHCYYGKVRNITYSAYVFVGLVIQHAKRMRPVILSSAVCLAVWLYQIFPHYLKNGRIFGKTEHKMSLLLFSTGFVWKCLILRRIRRYIIMNVHTFSCKVSANLISS
jgi:hypothetical protein